MLMSQPVGPLGPQASLARRLARAMSLALGQYSVVPCHQPQASHWSSEWEIFDLRPPLSPWTNEFGRREPQAGQ